MYQGGVDYIQTDSAATDTGIIQAANEGDGRMVSAISPAQYKLGPKTVITLVALDFGQSLYNEVSPHLRRRLSRAAMSRPASAPASSISCSRRSSRSRGPPDLVAKAKAVWPEIEKAKADILAGSLKVPFNTDLVSSNATRRPTGIDRTR